ncbi:hypothetical protein PYW08_010272 [Mythimna loreyi]|uniref:Uncharacterized protein n=1 Tax=Mythimna loreyi TaxID=667449 RepID=A0ACC2Q9Q6_9NEOP|nr:hypothetical protein PYW08_010272 [Mythimna loreyi]
MYLKQESIYNAAIKAINKKMSSISHREHTTPKIEIPTFGGSYHQWTSFKDLFTEAVHSNPSLSGAQKMQFLKSKVKGEAERLIQHLPISSDNYIISWDILSHRYDNKRMIFTSHINILLNIPISQQSSINHIKRIHDTALETMNAIQNLGVDVTSWGPLIVHLLCQKLDSDTFSEYNAAIKQPRELLELNEFLAFLEGKFTSMEASRRKQEINHQKSFSSSNNKPSESKNYHFKQSYSSNKAISQSPSYRKLQNNRPNCPVCNDAHAIFNCKQFADFSPMKKKQCVANLNYCQNCLYDHKGKECLSKKRCIECNGFHNTLLHDSNSKELSKQGGNLMPSTQQSNSRFNQERVNHGNTHVTQENNMMQETLLSTALLKVQKVDGTYLILRALIDQGSQMSLITENAAQQLGLKRSRCDGIITGIGQTENSCRGIMNLNCMSNSRIKRYQFNIDAYIMNNLTKYLPSYSFPKIVCTFLDNLELADPDYNISRPIDILLGADVYSNIILTGMCRLSESLPLVQETQLGWILCGNIKTKLMCNVVQFDLDRVQQFWEIENVTEEKSLSSEDQECIQYYKATTHRLDDGKYQVRLPL